MFGDPTCTLVGPSCRVDLTALRPHLPYRVFKIAAFLLVVGAFVGLFGQQAAYAAGPGWSTTVVTAIKADASTEASDCMKMMSEKPDQPCDGLTLDCIADMGCVVPITLDGAQPLVAEQSFEQPRARLPRTSPLAGRMVPPEPEPPAALI